MQFEGASVNRFDIGGVRYYSPVVEDGVAWEEREFAPSVTSILQVLNKGPFFHKWMRNLGPRYEEYMAYISFVGTVTHKLIDHLILGGEVDLVGAVEFNEDTGEMVDLSQKKYKKPISNFLTAFTKFWKAHEIVPLATEIQLTGKDTAGTIDLFCLLRYRRKLVPTLIDWKTRLGVPISDSGDHPGAWEHGLQLTGYKDLVEENYETYLIGEVEKPLDIGLMYNVYLGEKGGYTKKVRAYDPDGWAAVKGLWQHRYGQSLPKEPKTLVTRFTLEKDEEDEIIT